MLKTNNEAAIYVGTEVLRGKCEKKSWYLYHRWIKCKALKKDHPGKTFFFFKNCSWIIKTFTKWITRFFFPPLHLRASIYQSHHNQKIMKQSQFISKRNVSIILFIPSFYSPHNLHAISIYCWAQKCWCSSLNEARCSEKTYVADNWTHLTTVASVHSGLNYNLRYHLKQTVILC